MIHLEPSKFASMTLKIKDEVTHPQYPDFGGSLIRIEDWWDRVYGKSWKFSTGNLACIIYAIRSAVRNLPSDDEVLYGKVNNLGSLVHISEIELNEKGE